LSSIVLLLMGCVAIRASGQTVFAVSVNATVTGGFSIEATRIDFGRIVPGIARIVLPQANGRQGSAGRVLMTLNNGGISVSLPNEMTLSGPGAQIHASLRCAATASQDGRNTLPFQCADGVSFGPDDNAPAADRSTIYVGGVVPAAESSGKPPGMYSGSVIITANKTTT
jgi:hypothetical protein